jgi:transcriptional antiterminator RfaH
MDFIPTEEQLSWYCIRTQPRCENIALINLQQLENVDVFFPRTRQIKVTKRGKRKLVQPLFPNYLFIRFDPGQHTRSINYCQGVSYVIKNGENFTPVNPSIITDLISLTDEGIMQIEYTPFKVGDKTKFVTGLFKGNDCTVTGLLPAKERVKVLMEFMGNPTLLEVSTEELDSQEIENPFAKD